MEEVKQNAPDVLCQEIRKQSDSEVKTILEQAEAEVRKVMAEAEVAAEKIRQEILHQAHTKSDGLYKKILSGVHLEVKKARLKAREDLLGELFKAVEAEYQAFRKTPAYGDTVYQWVLEGLLALNQDKVEIRCGEPEKEWLQPKQIQAIQKAAQAQTGMSYSADISKSSLDQGGIIVSSADGRTRFDNSFEARIRRMQDDMRWLSIQKINEMETT